MTALPSTEELYRAMGRMVVRFYGRTRGADSVIASHAILACSGLDSIFLNCGVVFGSAPAGDDPAEARLREFVERISERGVGGYVCLSESVRAELEPLARRLGLEPLPAIPLMSRRGSAGGPETTTGSPAAASRPCRVRRVTDEDGLAAFLSVSEAAFDLPVDLYSRVVTASLLADPAIFIYVCCLEDAPVSCVCVVEEDGLAGISGMATLPEMQGQGIGGRLLDEALALHAGRSRAFFLTASEDGERLYRRHGFAVVDATTAWIVPPRAG